MSFEPSLFASELEPSKTYTVTWRSVRKWNKSGLWRAPYFSNDAKDLRLVKAGKLVARSATYQGV